MALTTHTIEDPGTLAAFARPELDWSCGTSWEGSLLGIQRYLGDIEKALGESREPLAQGFLVLEYRCAVVELLEYVGGIVYALRCGPRLSHTLNNHELRDVFDSVSAGVSREEAARILFLPRRAPSRGDRELDDRLEHAHSQILDNTVLVLKGIASYWGAHIDATRWYRHCPAFVSIEDTYRIDPTENGQREEARRKQEAIPDRLYTFVRLNSREFRHEVLRREDLQVARHVLDISLAVILTSFGNRVLDAHSTEPAERFRKIPKIMTRGILPADLESLCTHGPLLVVP